MWLIEVYMNLFVTNNPLLIEALLSGTVGDSEIISPELIYSTYSSKRETRSQSVEKIRDYDPGWRS